MPEIAHTEGDLAGQAGENRRDNGELPAHLSHGATTSLHPSRLRKVLVQRVDQREEPCL